MYSQILNVLKINKMFDFSTRTNNQYQGTIFRVTVCGKFVPISFLGNGFEDMFVVLHPHDIKMAPNAIYNATKEATQFYDILQLENMINENNFVDLQKRVQQIYHLITKESLSHLLFLLILYHDAEQDHHDAKTKLLQMSELLLNLKDPTVVTQMLFNVKTFDIHNDMKELCHMIWIEFINNDIDKMAIIKLRKLCEKFEVFDSKQLPGKVLLEYKTNNILSHIPQDLRKINWRKYIEHYISNNFPKQQKQVLLTQKTVSKEEKIETFINIMQQYDEIINITKRDT
eukprot:308630_1